MIQKSVPYAYIPPIYTAHYILSMEREATSAPPMPNARPLPPRMLAAGRPHFSLVGVAIGNGLTAPDIQVMSHADVAYALGLVSAEQRIKLLKAQLDVQQHVYAGQWYEAWQARTDLLEALVKVLPWGLHVSVVVVGGGIVGAERRGSARAGAPSAW